MWEPDGVTRRPIGVKTILSALSVVLALAVSACGDDDAPATATDDRAALSLDDLDGRVFASARVEGRRLVDGTRVRLGFDGDELSADAGCNHLFGSAALEGDTLVVSGMGGTEMGCPQVLHDQDAWLTGFLDAGATVTLTDDLLTLTGGNVVVELEEQDVPDPSGGGDPDEPVSNDG